jgi:hypothetical protein
MNLQVERLPTERKAQAAVSMTEADAIARVDPTDLRGEEAVIATVTGVKVETRNIVNTVTVAQGLERVVGKSVNPDAPIENKVALYANQWGLLPQVEEILCKAVKADIEVIAKAAAVVKTGQAAVEEDEDNVREVYDQKIVATGEMIPADERGEAKEIQGHRMIARSGPDDKR